MSDCISRKAAVDVLEERLQANGYSNVALVSEFNRSIGYLMRLPSAQLELPIKEKCAYCPHCQNCDVNDDLSIAQPEPCEDTISRQAVKEWLAKWEGYIDADIIARMQYRIIDVPSAQPERTGRWIPVDSYSAYGGDEKAWMAHGNPIAFYYCSECKEQNYMGEDGEPLLTECCPHCGARMEGE